MSCQTPASAERSLSPSDESRFVPRASWAAGSAVRERHFATASTAADGDAVRETGATGAVDRATEESRGEPTPAMDAGQSAIVGATISFAPATTPVSSPRSSPKLEAIGGAASRINPPMGAVGESAWHIALDIDKEASWGSASAASSRASSAAKLVTTSSFDGRSTTEYQVLEGIASTGTLEVEEVSFDTNGDEAGDAGAEGNEDVAAREKEEAWKREDTRDRDGNDRATAMASLSQCSTIPSLGDKTTPPAGEQTPKEVPGEDGGANVQSPSRLANAPPTVEKHPLTPLRNLHMCWEQEDNPIGDDLDTNQETAAVNALISVNDGAPGEEKAPPGTHLNAAESQRDKADDDVHNMSECDAFTLPLLKMQDALSSLFLVAYARLLSILGALIRLLRRPLLNAREGTAAHGTLEVDTVAVTEVDTAKKPSGRSGANVSKLFFGERLVELAGDSDGQTEEEKLQERHSVRKWDQQEHIANMTVEFKKALSGPTAATVLCAICALILATCARHCMPRHRITVKQDSADPLSVEEVDLRCFASQSATFVSLTPWEWEFAVLQTSREDVEEHPLDLQSLDEHDICCASTHTTTFASIPCWEFKLWSLATFGFFEEELFDDQDPVNESPSHWLFTFTIMSTVTSFFCAFVFRTKITPSAPSKSPGVLTGMWTTEEHQKFLEGYRVHGRRWKSVCDFVPTRTHTQVQSHGAHWLKMGSPLKMKKTRRLTPSPGATPTPRSKKAPETPSSTKSTPRKSNRTVKAPLKGILIQKDRNQLCSRVTLHKEERRTLTIKS